MRSRTQSGRSYRVSCRPTLLNVIAPFKIDFLGIWVIYEICNRHVCEYYGYAALDSRQSLATYVKWICGVQRSFFFSRENLHPHVHLVHLLI